MPDLNDIIKSINEMEGMTKGEKLAMFCVLIDAEKIIKELSFKATMLKMEMATESIVDQFTFAILSIARPELFEEKQDENKKDI